MECILLNQEFNKIYIPLIKDITEIPVGDYCYFFESFINEDGHLAPLSKMSWLRDLENIFYEIQEN